MKRVQPKKLVQKVGEPHGINNTLSTLKYSIPLDNRIAKSTVRLKDIITCIVYIKYNTNRKLFDILT
jgi:hypothetical protein